MTLPPSLTKDITACQSDIDSQLKRLLEYTTKGSGWTRPQPKINTEATAHIPFTLIVDYEAMYNATEGCSQERIRNELASRLVKEYLRTIVDVIKYWKPVHIEAFVELLGHKKEICIEVGPVTNGKYSEHYDLTIDNGQLRMVVSKNSIGWSTDTIHNSLQKEVEHKYATIPLKVKQDLRDNEAKMEQYRQSLNNNFNTEFKFVYDVAGLYNHPELDAEAKSCFVNLLVGYYEAVCRNLNQLATKHSNYVDLINKLVLHKEIVLQIGPEEKKTGNCVTSWEIRDGRLVYSRKGKYFNCYTFDSANGLEQVIDAANPSMSLNYLLSIEQAKPLWDKLMERLLVATGKTIEIVGVNWEEIYTNDRPKVPDDWKDQMPKIIVDFYLTRIVLLIELYAKGRAPPGFGVSDRVEDNLPRLFKCWTSGVIRFKMGEVKVNNAATCYGELTFDNGDMLFIVPHKTFNFNADWVGEMSPNQINRRVFIQEKEWIQQSGWKRPFCDICDENTEAATHICSECEDHLCQFHMESHLKGKKTKDHELQPVELTIPSKIVETKYCDHCDGQVEAKMYCGECEEYLCDFHVKDHQKGRKTKAHALVPTHLVGVEQSHTDATETSEEETKTVTEVAVDLEQELYIDDGVDRVNKPTVKKKPTKQELEKVYGKIKFVRSFGDYKVQEVRAFADVSVKKVNSLANSAGKWQIIEHGIPDYKIQLVNAFPDFTIEYVNSFPRVNKK